MKELDLWFLKNRRAFPWREERTPYKVWISEVMLQQTRASVVVAYFERWMKRFPDVKALSLSSIEEVIKLWEGLGYYSRARNLHLAANQIVERFQGEIPSTREELASIPGLGPYTVGAILSFGFSQRAAPIDGNVARVMSRYLAITENIDRSSVRRQIEEKTLTLLSRDSPWITAEALIELGALVCGATPDCQSCPLQKGCLAQQKGIALQLPIKNVKAAVISLLRAVAVIEAKGKILVRKTASGKVMADLYEFPYFEIKKKADSYFPQKIKNRFEKFCGFKIEQIGKCRSIKHTFTKYRAELYPFSFRAKENVEIPGWIWVPIEKIDELPFSAGHRAILKELNL